jgi:hypothetical protein
MGDFPLLPCWQALKKKTNANDVNRQITHRLTPGILLFILASFHISYLLILSVQFLPSFLHSFIFSTIITHNVANFNKKIYFFFAAKTQRHKGAENKRFCGGGYTYSANKFSWLLEKNLILGYSDMDKYKRTEEFQKR